MFEIKSWEKANKTSTIKAKEILRGTKGRALTTCIDVSYIKIFEIVKFDDERKDARCTFSVKANSLVWTDHSTDLGTHRTGRPLHFEKWHPK